MASEPGGEGRGGGQGGRFARDDVRLADPAAVEGRDDPRRGVVDMRHLEPDLAQRDVAKSASIHLAQDLSDQGVITGSVDLAWLGDDHRGPGRDGRLGDLVGAELRLVVCREEALGRVAAIGFIHLAAMGVAEDPDGRDIRDAGRTGGCRGGQDALGRPHVRLPHGRPLRSLDPDLVGARPVDQAIGAGQLLRERGGVGEVACDELDVRSGEVGGPLRVADQGDDVVTAVGEMPDDRTADEPAAARDDDAAQ